MIGTIAVPITKGVASDSTAHFLEILFALLFPTYALSNGISKIYTNEYGRRACKQITCSNPIYATMSKSCCGSNEKGIFFA